MIFVTKSDGSGFNTKFEKARKSNNENVYRKGKVFNRIKDDFHGKCYLCEDNEFTTIQIEHFEPHKSDLAKKFDWANLFYSCGHCNNIKGAGYWPMLNCTDPDDKVWESIEIRFTTFPKAKVEVTLNAACPKPAEGGNTQRLLARTLSGVGATPIQIEQAANLRKRMLRVFSELSPLIQTANKAALKAAIADSAPFAGMVRWHLKNEFPGLYDELNA